LAARDALVIEHAEWARGIAAAVARRLPTWFRAEDLVGPAEIGLIQAAERYDPAKNDNFRAYARRRVFGECIASIRRREYRQRAYLELKDTHADPRPGPDAVAQVAIGGSRVSERIAELPAAHAHVLRKHYWDGLTLAAIAERMKVSQAQACRLHREGLEMLRSRCRDLAGLAA